MTSIAEPKESKGRAIKLENARSPIKLELLAFASFR